MAAPRAVAVAELSRNVQPLMSQAVPVRYRAPPKLRPAPKPVMWPEALFSWNKLLVILMVPPDAYTAPPNWLPPLGASVRLPPNSVLEMRTSVLLVKMAPPRAVPWMAKLTALLMSNQELTTLRLPPSA